MLFLGSFLFQRRMYKWKLFQCLVYDLENRILIGLLRQFWNGKFFQFVFCVRVIDDDFRVKYSLESIIVYSIVGVRTVDLFFILVFNILLGFRQDFFVRCQYKYFVTDLGNDEEINVKKNVFKEDINGVLIYFIFFLEFFIEFWIYGSEC